MVNIQGTNPVSGNSVDAANPRTWVQYAIGGTVLVAGLMVGKFASELAADATDVGDTVNDKVLSLS